MKEFKENNCRLCKKIFCCKKCREQHEKQKHNIYPNCDICIYGKTVLSSTSPSLTKHLRSKHWPLHCLICKRLFGSVNELFQHTKCPLGSRTTSDLEKSPYISVQSCEENTYDSTPVISTNYFEKSQYFNKNLNIISNLATSTPMQREENNFFEKIQEVIVTPENYLENSKHSIIKKSNSDPPKCGSFMKRRVTFGETQTPLTESQYRPRYMTTMASKENQDYNDMDSKDTSEALSSEYHSAKEEQSPITIETSQKPEKNIPSISVTAVKDAKFDDTKEEGNQKTDITNTPHRCEDQDNTVWISAINVSTTNIYEDDTSCHHNPSQFQTPVVPNHKKKQISIVMPTPVIKEEISIKFKGPVQISSTPNSSIIPVKSAPKHRDIFRSVDLLPTSSNSNVEAQIDDQKNGDSKDSLSENCRDHKTEISNESSDISVHSLWTSVGNIVKNVTNAIQGFTSADQIFPNPSKSMKRYSSEYDFSDGPSIKRYKLTDIKCRRTIREIPPLERLRNPNALQESNEIHINIVNDLRISTNKTFADKATQTDDSIFF